MAAGCRPPGWLLRDARGPAQAADSPPAKPAAGLSAFSSAIHKARMVVHAEPPYAEVVDAPEAPHAVLVLLTCAPGVLSDTGVAVVPEAVIATVR
jgi:hypothetical protein